MHSHASSSGSGAEAEDDDQTMESSSTTTTTPVLSSRKVGGKPNVSAACGPCKKAHLACDVARPCKRCVNMGKEDACTDVPHKKRGRPKTIRPQIDSSGPLERSVHSLHRPGPPTYQSMRSGSDRGRGYGEVQFRRSHPKLSVSPSDGYSSQWPMLVRHASHPYSRHTSPESAYEGMSSFASAPSTPPPPPAASIFTLFASTPLQIVRATPECQSLTGYLPHEYVNLSLFQFIHPEDVGILENDRVALLQNPRLPEPLRSLRDTLAAMAPTGPSSRSETELLSPAEGMHQPYPNRNVRVLRADNEYDLYNVRLHVGGGLGANLYRPETYGRSYLVISMLRLPPEVAIKFHRASTRRAQSDSLRPPAPARSVSTSGYISRSGSRPSSSFLSALSFDDRESLTISPIDQRSPTSPGQTSLPPLRAITSTIPPPQHPQHAHPHSNPITMARSLSGPGPGHQRTMIDSHAPLPPLAMPRSYSPNSDARPTSSAAHSDSRLLSEREREGHPRERGFTPRSAPLPIIDHTRASPVPRQQQQREEVMVVDSKRDLKRIWE